MRQIKKRSCRFESFQICITVYVRPAAADRDPACRGFLRGTAGDELSVRKLGFAAQMGALRDHRGYNILSHLAHLD
jgi:hypothetical protein